ncbi:hypothetical protein ACFRKB_27950, partial [Streptomyces scopuliridis]|uniref:hypothetical protein n=1 Tax=Streptomyces scopuliridis TaxID=452529 RepID=UPI00367725C3
WPLYRGTAIPLDSWRNRLWLDTWVLLGERTCGARLLPPPSRRCWSLSVDLGRRRTAQEYAETVPAQEFKHCRFEPYARLFLQESHKLTYYQLTLRAHLAHYMTLGES